MTTLKPPVYSNGDMAEPEWHLTIRFSASIPDLLLSLPSTPSTTASTLKQAIRQRLPAEYAKHRIRLIHSGKALADDASLSTALRRQVSKPPSRVATPGPYDSRESLLNADTQPQQLLSAKARGKLPIREQSPQPQTPPASRIYIHCSIGDLVLTEAELADEAHLANPERQSSTHQPEESPLLRGTSQDEKSRTTPAPRGFDRLLSAGFTTVEVQSLRLQFLSIQAHTHTPDTMPSPNTLRNMEDRWLDNSNTAGPGNLDGLDSTGGIGSGITEDDDGQTGALDDMLWGTATGFFWPIGCLVWGVREDGIWSQRRKMAIVVGVILNIGLGVVKYTR